MKWRWRKRKKEKNDGALTRRGKPMGRIFLKVFMVLTMASLLPFYWLHAGKGESRTSGLSSSLRLEAAKYPGDENGSAASFHRIREGKFTEDRGPYRFVYTIDPVLQISTEEVFRTHRPSLGVFVAIEPRTGKLLALVDYSQQGSENGCFWNRATYPAASVFKLITAACALEKGILDYNSPVSFWGNQYRLAPGKINKAPKREQQTYFDDALGKSNNVVFGRVASKLIGPQTLRHYSEAFGFNRPLKFDFPLDTSKAIIPDEIYQLARCGAGFGEVTLNPIHAALIASCIASDGMMMRPFLIDAIRNQEGEVLYEARAEVLTRPISAKTAEGLNRMMRRTVEDGTASKSFHRYGQNFLKQMSVSGKTGSLSGDDPPGLYDWFVGFAPADAPQIAFSAMVINRQRRKMIRGAFVAQEALKVFFQERMNPAGQGESSR